MLINDSKDNGLTVPRVFKSLTLVSGNLREFLSWRIGIDLGRMGIVTQCETQIQKIHRSTYLIG